MGLSIAYYLGLFSNNDVICIQGDVWVKKGQILRMYYVLAPNVIKGSVHRHYLERTKTFGFIFVLAHEK